jgi:cyclic-di-GMP-binding protein
MPSFDVVSKVDVQEIDNAVNNTLKELDSRYDLKGTDAKIEWKPTENKIVLTCNSAAKLDTLREMLYSKMVKRGLDLMSVKVGEVTTGGRNMSSQELTVQQGIDQASAKKIVAEVKESKLKVQASIQGDQLRVNGKNRDDLQAAIAHLRAKDFGLPLQFNNFRE